MKFEPVIGLEIHAQLSTNTKIFCGCSTRFGADANTQTCPVCLGMPGVLPVLNQKVVEYAVLMGLAVNCQIREKSVFARKNYFYPDLPKGYQISQYEEPICEHGHVTIQLENGESKHVGITRIHLEEDAGKSVHEESYVREDESLVDVNRCGIPLIEIVSEPEMFSPEEAYLYLTKLRQMLRWLGVCDGNMEEGSLRCDANISMRPAGTKGLGTKTELKNMNTFRGVEKALAYEIRRQSRILESGGEVKQQTLLWDESAGVARSMRGKEDAHDYRYFPDPDLLPLIVNQDWQQTIAASLPELPDGRKKRWQAEYGLSEYECGVLNEEKTLSDYADDLLSKVKDPKKGANWIMGEVLAWLNEQSAGIDDFPVKTETLAEIIRHIEKGTLSHSAGKQVFEEILKNGGAPESIIKKLGLAQVSDSSELESMVDVVLRDHQTEVETFLKGKERVLGFLVGQVMKASRGKANPGMVNELIREKLKNLKAGD